MELTPTCGATKPGWEERPCARRKDHRGKHVSRLGSSWPQPGRRVVRQPYRRPGTGPEGWVNSSGRYLPPHRRTEGSALLAKMEN